MRQPNTHHIRQFNDRARQASGPGKQIMENAEIRGLQAELLDVMCYISQLENRIAELEHMATITDVTVEISGGDFLSDK